MNNHAAGGSTSNGGSGVDGDGGGGGGAARRNTKMPKCERARSLSLSLLFFACFLSRLALVQDQDAMSRAVAESEVHVVVSSLGSFRNFTPQRWW